MTAAPDGSVPSGDRAQPVGDATHRASLLQASRRVDWRFLLPDPEFGRVVLVGRPDAALVESLALFSGTLTLSQPGHGSAETVVGTHDVAVAVDPTSEELQVASQLLRPGGWLYVERRRPRSARGLALRLARREIDTLDTLGFSRARVHWHWPTFSASAIVPLADPAALELAVSRRTSAGGRNLRVLGGRLLVRLGLIEALVSHASIVACKDGDEGGGLDTVATFLAAHRDRLGLDRLGVRDRPSLVLLTPRFRASRHVVALVLRAGTSELALVVKVPRLAGDDGGVARETANLRFLERAEALRTTVPRVVACERHHGRTVLVQTALAGAPIDPAAIRRDRDRWVDTVLAWLAELGRVGDRADAGSSGAYERLLERPLRRFADLFPSGSEEHILVDRTLEAVRPLRKSGLPAVAEHGDLSHPNLIALPHGRIGAVDWELAETQGLPLHDACFFLAYVAFAARSARGDADHAAAFHDAFLGPRPWAAQALRSFAERLGVPRSLLTPLFVACWARYAAGLVERLGADAGVGPAGDAVDRGETIAWLRANRYVALWRHSLDHAHALPWEDPVNPA